MRDARGATGSGPTVCPFVALVEDRDRRADGPDTRNRCYATPAPRQRELAYQAEYCYGERFPSCAAFLDWAARNAAEPSYPVPGIQAARVAEATAATSAAAGPHVEPAAQAGGPVEPSLREEAEASSPGVAESADWVSASAWAAYPGAAVEEADDEEADDEEADDEDADTVPEGDEGALERDEPTTAPRVPAALPMRRRRRPLQPIRTRGSGEWYYSDPPEREPLVRRRFSAIPPVVLGAVGLLVAALVVLLIPSLLAGGDGGPRLASASSSPGISAPPATPRPRARRTPEASPASATPEPAPRRRTYRVRSGDSLSRIASRFDIPMELLQCQNLIRDPDLITVGQQLTIPPEGYVCAPGWRRATPTPLPRATPAAAAELADPEA